MEKKHVCRLVWRLKISKVNSNVKLFYLTYFLDSLVFYSTWVLLRDWLNTEWSIMSIISLDIHNVNVVLIKLVWWISVHNSNFVWGCSKLSLQTTKAFWERKLLRISPGYSQVLLHAESDGGSPLSKLYFQKLDIPNKKTQYQYFQTRVHFFCLMQGEV